MKIDDFVTGGPAEPARKPSRKRPAGLDPAPVAAESGPDARKIELLQKVLKGKQLQRDETPLGEEPADFIDAVERFVSWIKNRSYIRGDIDTIKQMLANLVTLDPTIAAPFSKQQEPAFLDTRDFLRKAKQHDSLHPDQALLGKQEYQALARRDKGEQLTSTDYRHLKLLKDKVKNETRKAPFWAYLERIT